MPCFLPSPNKPQLGTPRKIGQGCKFRSFTTNNYKCNFLEVPSGIKVDPGGGPCMGRLGTTACTLWVHALRSCAPALIHATSSSESRMYRALYYLVLGGI